MNSQQYNANVSVLASLRRLNPERPLELLECLRIAELQAGRLRELTAPGDTAMPESAVAELPRIRILRTALPTSGMSYWNGRGWMIAINNREPEGRQRFTLFHEYKHIVDHHSFDRLHLGSDRHSPDEQAEQVADYFAGCVFMPRRLMKRAWGDGMQTPKRLAEHFEVSERAVEVRLAQLGLTTDIKRCAPPTMRRAHTRRPCYYRLGRSQMEAVA